MIDLTGVGVIRHSTKLGMKTVEPIVQFWCPLLLIMFNKIQILYVIWPKPQTLTIWANLQLIAKEHTHKSTETQKW